MNSAVLPRLCLALLVLTSLGMVSSVAGAAPEARRYELVSPVEKGGGDILTMSSRTRAAADGNGVVYASLRAFGDAAGTTVGVEYLARRSGSGWVSHAITPPMQDPFPFWLTFFTGSNPFIYEVFSDDLSRGVLRSGTPLTEDPNVEKVPNLYVRTDLAHAGAGTYDLLTVAEDPLPALDPSVFPFLLPWVAGASTDFRHITFETALNLTGDASGSDVKLYEWVDGAVRLAGVLPGDVPALSSAAGQGAAGFVARSVTDNTISSDGSRIIFTAPVGTSSNQGNPIDESQLYMRIDGTDTVHISASEKAVPDEARRAVFAAATPDGSAVFFTTTEALVEADVDSDLDIYRYDATRPDTAPDNLSLISGAASVFGVIGVSDDGAYVYWAGGGNDPGVYVWHDGDVKVVGELEGIADQIENTTSSIGAGGYARVTPDGTHLMFISRHGILGYDHGVCDSYGSSGGCREVYVYDAVEDSLQCASCNPTGAPATGHARLPVVANTAGTLVGEQASRFLADTGRSVFFTSPEPLVDDDQNNRLDAYEFDIETGEAQLLSSGTSTSHSYFLDASADGLSAFFVTRQRLVGHDTDDHVDLYAARVGGGFPEPETPAVPCAADACAPAGSSAAEGLALGSTTLIGKDAASPARSRFRLLPIGAGALRRWARSGEITLRLDATAPGRIVAKARARIDGRLRRVAGGAADAREGIVRLRLTLTRAARDELRTHGRLRVVVVARHSRLSTSRRAVVVLRISNERGL